MEYVIGFAGNGSVTLRNATELLENWLTDDIVVADFWVPAEFAKRTHPGLAAVVSYLDGNWQKWSTGSPEEIMEALAKAQESGNSAVLVVIIGRDTEPDEQTADMMEQAWQAGVPVRDLAAGLFEVPEPDSDNDRKEEAEEPPPPRRTPAQRRGERGKPRKAPEAGNGQQAPAPEAPAVPPPSADEIRQVVGSTVREVLALALSGALASLQEGDPPGTRLPARRARAREEERTGR